MFLTDETQTASQDLPIPAFRDHLRLGTGFSDDDVQDALLDRLLRGAIQRVEILCGKALMERRFVLTLHAWRNLGRQVLPRAPLQSVEALTIHDMNDGRELVGPDRYHVEPDTHRPSIVARGFALPNIPVGGHATITFVAGYGPDWASVPDDLANAIFALAAIQYETRTALGTVPPDIQAQLSPYRQPRLLGGF